ncbi:MAG TPA: SpvB/TcaC N-terminal domain-containing protein, partial [Nitrolancea sp.]|nr:SpvB/TcaC N-terminal domain-containing protein [Nitrolancea sp.]
MSTKAATSSPAIALPKGGGALTGIGETFSPDLHTGTGNFSVPIALPPGRHGFQPELSLRYSSGSGNGPFGLGWGLNMPSISRKTSRGLPRYDEAIDTFIFAGAEDLVPVASMPTCTYYRPRTEGLFARIMHVHSADDNYWEVRTTDGRVDLYGTPRPTTAPATWRDPASVADPDRPEHIFTWQLTRTT